MQKRLESPCVRCVVEEVTEAAVATHTGVGEAAGAEGTIMALPVEVTVEDFEADAVETESFQISNTGRTIKSLHSIQDDVHKRRT